MSLSFILAMFVLPVAIIVASVWLAFGRRSERP